jgi:hypothetical protein
LWIVFVFKFIEISFLPAFCEIPLEECELQLMVAENKLSAESSYTTCNITFRKDKRRRVSLVDESKLTENQFTKAVEIGSQAEALPTNL